jgi:phenylalanyl-tRNA synthetase beta chain
VFFEAAYFDPETIQGRARALSLVSDAAHRFERGVDFGGTLNALERATAAHDRDLRRRRRAP